MFMLDESCVKRTDCGLKKVEIFQHPIGNEMKVLQKKCPGMLFICLA